MSKISHSLWAITAITVFFSGCGQEPKENTNPLYEQYQKHPAPKVLYPKSTTSQNTHPATHAPAPKPVQHTTNKPKPHIATSHTATTPAAKPTTPQEVANHPTPKPKQIQTTQAQNPTTIHTKNSITYQMPTPPIPVKPTEPKAEIAKAMKAVEAVKADAAKKILDSLKIIQAVKPIHATSAPKPVPSAVDVVKAEAVAEIAKATAFAQSANAVAKAKIAQSVAEVEKTKAKKYPSLAEKLFGEK